MENWCTEELRQEVRKIFEPRYKRKLTDEEIVSIAVNLADLMEGYLKLKWREKYGTTK